MENKKVTINLSTFILSLLLIITIFVGIILFMMNNNKIKNSNSSISQNNKLSDIKNEEVSESNSSNSINNSKNSLDNEFIVQNNKKDNNTPIEKPTTGKESSKTNPLSIGNYGVAYQRTSKTNIDVPVKVTNVTRGNSAKKMVKQYCDSGVSIYRYDEPKEGMEWAVIDYTVDLTNVPATTEGKKVSLDSKITGTGDNTSIKYNNNIYIVSTINMSTKYSKETIAHGKFAAQLPIGCTDYLIVLGTQDKQAFFKGI